MVPRKGVGMEIDWVLKDMVEELRVWGYTGGAQDKLIFKSDGEASMIALRNQLAKMQGGITMVETSAKHEHQSNGVAEESVKSVRGMMLTLKSQLEKNIGDDILRDSCVVQWMLRWAAMLLSRYQVGLDGRTGYERRRGRACTIPTVCFGEKVWFKESKDKEAKAKFHSQWRHGIWLGHTRASSEAWIGTSAGVVRTYNVKRLPKDERWDCEMVKNMKGTPQKPNPKLAGEEAEIVVDFPEDLKEAPAAEEQDEGLKTRRVMITDKELSHFGYTPGCPGCASRKQGRVAKKGHSEACRARIEKEMLKTAEGQKKLDRSKERMVEAIARDLERQDQAQSGAAEAGASGIAAGDQLGAGRESQRPAVNPPPPPPPQETLMEPGPQHGGDDGMDLGGLDQQPDVAELYSPMRVTAEAAKFSLKPGEAMDLKTGWDFSIDRHRDAARRYIVKARPKLLIGSPMCTMFSNLQNFRPWTKERERRLQEAKVHMEFTISMYRLQRSLGGHFLHEHPASATSWKLKCVKDLAYEDGVHMAVADLCMYGLETEGSTRGSKVKAQKTTRFMTSSAEIARNLCRRCDKSHWHQALVNGRASRAGEYPTQLCSAICRGLIKQLELDEKSLKTLLSLKATDIVHDKPPPEEDKHLEAVAKAWDDVTGKELDPVAVKRARLQEMEYTGSKRVWDKIDRQEALRNGWPIVDTRWIDINKGDEQSPNHRSRLVAKEFADSKSEGLFAATPPLETLRVLISEAATVAKGQQEKVMMIADVARAFFEAAVIRDICVELPDEAKDENDVGRDVIGKLRLSLYGTRDAAANFQRTVREFMESRGWISSQYCPCSFRHLEKGLAAMVHGDDFVVTGSRDGVAWFRKELQQRFEIKVKIIGSRGINYSGLKGRSWADLMEEEDHDEVDEARVLNRIVRVTETGWEYEADQRHADLLIKGMGMEDANSTKTPGEDDRESHMELLEELGTRDAREFRGLAARANYLALDRPDLQYAAKEVCRGMATPLRAHLKALRRMARYLIGAPRLVWEFGWQGVEGLSVYSDANWAGCRRTARSSSGGSIMRGKHCLKTWSSTQKRVTLSSAESELTAATKASVEAIGMTQLMEGLGHQTQAEVFVDSSAALAVVGRRGNGKLRHVRVGELWIQEIAHDGVISYRKVAGSKNSADLMTKHVPAALAAQHLGGMRLRIEGGRARLSLEA